MKTPQPILSVGDRIGDRVILKVDLDPAGVTNNTYYNFRCDCGHEAWILHQPMWARVKKKMTGCRKCMVRKSSAAMCYGYRETVDAQTFIDQFWKPASGAR